MKTQQIDYDNGWKLVYNVDRETMRTVDETGRILKESAKASLENLRSHLRYAGEQGAREGEGEIQLEKVGKSGWGYRLVVGFFEGKENPVSVGHLYVEPKKEDQCPTK